MEETFRRYNTKENLIERRKKRGKYDNEILENMEIK